jgi:hypothetical protein
VKLRVVAFAEVKNAFDIGSISQLVVCIKHYGVKGIHIRTSKQTCVSWWGWAVRTSAEDGGISTALCRHRADVAGPIANTVREVIGDITRLGDDLELAICPAVRTEVVRVRSTWKRSRV